LACLQPLLLFTVFSVPVEPAAAAEDVAKDYSQLLKTTKKPAFCRLFLFLWRVVLAQLMARM
jgi:hypothetical protein